MTKFVGFIIGIVILLSASPALAVTSAPKANTQITALQKQIEYLTDQIALVQRSFSMMVNTIEQLRAQVQSNSCQVGSITPVPQSLPLRPTPVDSSSVIFSSSPLPAIIPLPLTQETTTPILNQPIIQQPITSLNSVSVDKPYPLKELPNTFYLSDPNTSTSVFQLVGNNIYYFNGVKWLVKESVVSNDPAPLDPVKDAAETHARAVITWKELNKQYNGINY